MQFQKKYGSLIINVNSDRRKEELWKYMKSRFSSEGYSRVPRHNRLLDL